MSRSGPPRSNIVARLRQSSHAIRPSRSADRPFRRRLGIRFARLMRWLHIYLSMFSLAVVLFFSVTGITLNHPDWFYSAAERTDRGRGTNQARMAAPAGYRGRSGRRWPGRPDAAGGEARGRRAPPEHPQDPRRPRGVPGGRERMPGRLSRGPATRRTPSSTASRAITG